MLEPRHTTVCTTGIRQHFCTSWLILVHGTVVFGIFGRYGAIWWWCVHTHLYVFFCIGPSAARLHNILWQTQTTEVPAGNTAP